ncbi:LptF/LptG family permease [Breznakiella homolactica]|uniref:LptF/LptG family permease n=1 Tax=Breznakiella homolactica TaxID=2798577 RepID=A0A7T7XKY9_9SPIR|nr:LptF/LptG family permease [Breznakiella homolactica]QQO08183.1 LptF/LptG family permease [Breznakiella homolactica]
MILDRYLARQFAPVFAVALSMFMLLLSLIDLFANLWRYLNNEVPVFQILQVSLYYLPKSLSYALPISLLFATAYTLGDLYARNELTAVFSSGIPYRRFCLPFVVIGLAASVFSFFFEDQVVIPTFKMKNTLSKTLLRQPQSANNSDIVIKTRNGKTIYSVDYYDDSAKTLNGISIVEQSETGEFEALIRAPRAVWDGDRWQFENGLIYRWDSDILRAVSFDDSFLYTETPDAFRRSAVNVEELPAGDAALLVEDLKLAGLPYVAAQADYLHRYSFPSASFVVIILSIAMGGRFKKNILLMSLLSSLAAAVVFYIMEMITMMMAKLGYIPPFVGAWFPIVSFIVIGMVLMRSAKT